jgi:hypothetical protein
MEGISGWTEKETEEWLELNKEAIRKGELVYVEGLGHVYVSCRRCAEE